MYRPNPANLLLILGMALVMPVVSLAGGSIDDDPFGDLIQTQQATQYDDSVFQQVLQQEVTDFNDVSKHRKPVRDRIRPMPTRYRVIDSDFDVFWDTVSFRSREAQGEGAALVTVMFKDVARFDPRARNRRFSVRAFVGTALEGCGDSGGGRVTKGGGTSVSGGFAGFDTSVGARIEKDSYKSSSSLDLDLDVSIFNQGERQPWDERVGPGGGGYPGAYGDPSLRSPRRGRYVVGGYTGLYDFSRGNPKLVRNFLTRAAQDTGYERLFDHRYLARSQSAVYRQVKNLLRSSRMPVLTLMPGQRDAVLIYRIIERTDGLGAMLYWRPSDRVGDRVANEVERMNVIWAVPQSGGDLRFIDRAELKSRKFRFGNRATMLIIPNLCKVYGLFADYLAWQDLGDPGYRPTPGKGDNYPPDYGPLPPYDQGGGDDWGYYPPPRRVPPRRRPPRQDDGDRWGNIFELIWKGTTDQIRTPPFNPYPPRPIFPLDPPIWTPLPPIGPPPDDFQFRPPIPNPYVDKPVGTGRGGFVKIGFFFNEEGYNRYGFDVNGLDRDGFDPWGYNRQGYGRDGFDPWGYDRGGYDRRGFSLFNRARNFLDLVNQYHRNPYAFRMQFDVKEDGTIVRIVDGTVVWDNSGAGGGGTVPGVTQPITPVSPPPPGVIQKPEVAEWRDTTIKGKITGIAAPWKIQLDRQDRYHILKDNKRTAIPRNIDVNRDFEMKPQDATKDYLYIQNTPPTR